MRCGRATRTEASQPELELLIVHDMSYLLPDSVVLRSLFIAASLCFVSFVLYVGLVLSTPKCPVRALFSLDGRSSRNPPHKKLHVGMFVNVDASTSLASSSSYTFGVQKSAVRAPGTSMFCAAVAANDCPELTTYCHCCVIADAIATLSAPGFHAKLATAT